MERCGGTRSVEKRPRVEAPPCLQVIGFSVFSPPKKAAEAAPATSSRGSLDMVSSATTELPISLSGQLCKPVPSSSPRSALQKLLLHQSIPTTSPTCSNHSLPPLKSSPIQNPRLELLQPLTSPPTAANQKRLSGGLLQPFSTSPSLANQKWTSGTSKPQSPPSAYQSNSSNGCLKPLVQSELTTLDISTNQSSHTSFFSSLSQSQCANASVISGGSQMINQHIDAKPGRKAVLIKEKNEAFFQVRKTGDDGTGVKAHELEDPWVNAKPGHPHAAKSQKSRWLHNDDNDPSTAKSKKSSWLDNDNDNDDDDDDDDHPSAAERCKKSSWKGVKLTTERVGGIDPKHLPGEEKSWKSSRSEEKSKKSSVFIMLVASSPAAPDYQHQGHSVEHNAFKTMDFLSSCHLCRRPLGQGQDVFMYSGDKAFCSMECRYQQLVIDERKERCPPPIIRSGASPVFHHTAVTATATHHPIMINKPYNFVNTAAVA